MIIKKIELWNVRCHKHLVVNLVPGVNQITGENGAGKTSVLQGMSWAIFDYIPFSQKNLISLGEKEARAAVTFEHGGQAWKVSRSTREGMRVYRGDKPVAQGKKESTIMIQRALGIDHDLSSLYRDALGPAQVGGLLAGFGLSEKARQDYWGPVLKLDKYRSVWSALRKPLSLLERQVAGIEGARESLVQVFTDEGMPADRDKLNLASQVLLEEEKKIEQDLSDLEKELQGLRAELVREDGKRKEAEEKERKRKDYQGRLRGIERDLLSLKGDEEKAALLPHVLLERAKIEVDEDLADQFVLSKQEEARIAASQITIGQQEKQTKAEVIRAKKAWGMRTVAEEELFDLEMSLTAQQETVQSLVVEISRLGGRLGQLDSLLALEKGDPCPTCGQALPDSLEEAIEERLDGEADLKVARAKMRRAEESLKKSKSAIKVCQGIIADGCSEEEVERVQERADQLAVDLDNLREDHSRAVHRMAESEKAAQDRDCARSLSQQVDRLSSLDREVKRRKKSLLQQKERLEGDIADLVPVECLDDEQVESLVGQALVIQKRVEESRNRLVGLAAEGTKVAGMLGRLSRLKGIQNDLESKEKAATVLGRVRQAISDAGPIVAGQATKSLTALANRYWKQGGKAGALTWDGTYLLSWDSLPFSLLSGGERVAAALAARLAVAKFSAGLDWIVLDEPTNNLDKWVKPLLAQLLTKLQLDQLIVVSHDSVFEPYVRHVVEIGVTL